MNKIIRKFNNTISLTATVDQKLRDSFGIYRKKHKPNCDTSKIFPKLASHLKIFSLTLITRTNNKAYTMKLSTTFNKSALTDENKTRNKGVLRCGYEARVLPYVFNEDDDFTFKNSSTKCRWAIHHLCFKILIHSVAVRHKT